MIKLLFSEGPVSASPAILPDMPLTGTMGAVSGVSINGEIATVRFSHGVEAEMLAAELPAYCTTGARVHIGLILGHISLIDPASASAGGLL